ncbi:hypothetical protein ABZ930_30270 [Streptomyces sp. NPDC046716]|uniref:hypothetical protein n=1 Tax=Streptomyces sp. NPDC046716 TaxID=3157093 RepID=UPI0034081801
MGASVVVTLCAWNVGADERDGVPGLEPVLGLGPPFGVEVEFGVEPGVDPGVVPGVVLDADVLDGEVDVDDGSVEVGVPVCAAAGC